MRFYKKDKFPTIFCILHIYVFFKLANNILCLYLRLFFDFAIILAHRRRKKYTNIYGHYIHYKIIYYRIYKILGRYTIILIYFSDYFFSSTYFIIVALYYNILINISYKTTNYLYKNKVMCKFKFLTLLLILYLFY